MSEKQRGRPPWGEHLERFSPGKSKAGALESRGESSAARECALGRARNGKGHGDAAPGAQLTGGHRPRPCRSSSKDVG